MMLVCMLSMTEKPKSIVCGAIPIPKGLRIQMGYRIIRDVS